MPDPKRRTPRTRRGLATLEAIYEATARILQADGLAGLNTNRVAEVAGVSIGALYAYFPDKQAILLAMAERELEGQLALVEQALLGAGPGEDPVRLAVRALIASYAARTRARRILMETLIAAGGSGLIARPSQRLADSVAANLGRLLPEGTPAPSELQLFVVIRAVDGVVRQASHEDAQFIGEPEFEDEVVRLVWAYLTAPQAPPPPPGPGPAP